MPATAPIPHARWALLRSIVGLAWNLGGFQDWTTSAFQKGEVIGQAFVVVEEIFADQVPAISEAENKFLMPEVSVVPHQVPDDRTYSDIDKGFRDRVRMLAQARPEAAENKTTFMMS